MLFVNPECDTFMGERAVFSAITCDSAENVKKISDYSAQNEPVIEVEILENLKKHRV